MYVCVHKYIYRFKHRQIQVFASLFAVSSDLALALSSAAPNEELNWKRFQCLRYANVHLPRVIIKLRPALGGSSCQKSDSRGWSARRGALPSARCRPVAVRRRRKKNNRSKTWSQGVWGLNNVRTNRQNSYYSQQTQPMDNLFFSHNDHDQFLRM